ncbi:hypothetical protein QRX60_35190 [Amycolatopsis mongoliensis]|uniref:Uncharacterized protein n=1 Tax=Amycolatopsis mongoliensis TaxID=715475 RepID=A0A9Y2JIR9_9PSEU|nr:hypothetical protein [Amycolatopsis sp. 4-36]WIX99269.1 hypothetical protein QRX60_35190 [Amycolatopsis sp. 4-36]
MKKQGTWSRTDKIARWSLVVSVAALLLAATPLIGDWIAWLREPAASISSLDQNATLIGENQKISGRADHLPKDGDLWLIVRTADPGDWYPQQKLEVSSDGIWNGEFDLGTPGRFQLSIYLADRESSGVLANSVETLEKNGFTKGVVSLPTQLVLMDSRAVIRAA